MTERLLRRRAVEEMTGLSRSGIYAMMGDNLFPKPVRIGKRAVAWRQSDLESWLNTCDVGARRAQSQRVGLHDK